MTELLMPGEELERNDAHGGGGGGIGSIGTAGSANVTHESDGGPDDFGHEDQKLQSPLGQDENSTTAKDCYSDAPLSGTEWQGEEMSLRLHPASPVNGAGYKRSPTRGMLRAVSSITITDIEAFEEGFSTMRGSIPHAPLVDVHTNASAKKLSPVAASMSTENTSPWSPSGRGATGQKPRRGVGKSRRRREQRGESWYSDDDILDEMGSPDRPPFAGGVGEDTVSMASLIRRKSIDILPNVPKRAPSTQDLADGGGKASNKTRSNEDSEMKSLMQRLHDELYLPGPKAPKLPNPSPLDNNIAHLRGTSPLDMFATFPPRRPVGGELAVDRFDRFNSDVDPFTNLLLPRHQSLDGMLFPGKGVPARTSLAVGLAEVGGDFHTSKLTGDDESESEPESSHFRVREFVVSLDFLEDNKRRGDMPRRRRSFDALPTPPRRFLDELEADDGDETSVRRRSFDDLGNARRRPLENETQSGTAQDYGPSLDVSHRSQQNNIREGGSTALDVSHRSQIGYPLDQSARSQQGYSPLDCSHRSQTNGSAELNDEDRSIRRTSYDILPALPRRRFASESSSSSDSELTPLPLRMDDALVQKKAADVVPNAPRRTDSGIGSKASSLSFSDFHLDEATLSSSSAVKDPPASSPKLSLHLVNQHNHNTGQLRLKSSDQIPSLPTRDHSVTAFDIFDISSEDQGNHADTEDNGGSNLEPDYESMDGTTLDRSLVVPIKDSLASSSRYHGSNGMMHRSLVESSIIEGGTSEELSPTTSDYKNSGNSTSKDDHHRYGDEDDGDNEDDHEDDEDDTETTSLDNNHQDMEAEASLKRNRANRRRKKKSSFLLRLFASRN